MDPFNAGKALVKGVEEVLMNLSFLNLFLFHYHTLTNAKFLTVFGSTQDIWGIVSNGDRIPYIPQHQLNSSLSFITDKIDININANYNGEFSTIADGSEKFNPILLLICLLTTN